MSTMSLAMPSSFVDIERDEMEYVDGGARINWSISGVELLVSKDQCADLAAILAGAGATVGVVAGLLGLSGNVPAAMVATIATGIIGLGSAYMWYCSNGNGFHYKFNFIGPNSWGRL